MSRNAETARHILVASTDDIMSPSTAAVISMSLLLIVDDAYGATVLASAIDHIVTPKRTEARYARLLCAYCREYGAGPKPGVYYLSKFNYERQLHRSTWYWSCPECEAYVVLDEDYHARPMRPPTTVPEKCRHEWSPGGPEKPRVFCLNCGEDLPPCDHQWEEQPGEPPRDVCVNCGEERY